MVARYLEINKPQDPTIRDFKETGYKYKMMRDDNEAANKLDEKEKQNYQSLQYFKELLKYKNIEEIKNKNEHYGYLLTALLTLQPPLRSDFYTSCRFSNGESMEKNKNYLIIQKTKDFTKLFFNVGSDKVSNSNIYKTKPDLNIIEIENNDLINIILKSYELYPRVYLFQNDNGEPYTGSTVLKFLKKFTHVKGLNINMMRSIYITDTYNANKLTYKQKENLAHKMRHSVNTQAKNYFKLIEEDEKPTAADEIINTLKKELTILRVENNKLKDENDELKKLTQLTKDTPEYNKKRRDIIYNGNKGKKVKYTTLEKYNIKYDETTKKYY